MRHWICLLLDEFLEFGSSPTISWHYRELDEFGGRKANIAVGIHLFPIGIHLQMLDFAMIFHCYVSLPECNLDLAHASNWHNERL